MRGIFRAAGYVPYHRLRREAISSAVGGGRGRGTRAVASWDEDATTMAVAAGRLVLSGGPAPRALVFASSTPAYLDKTNATAVHAALRLDRDTRATDAGGAPRSSVGALLAALEGSGTTLVTSADVRTGAPGSPDEAESGDAGAAVLVGSADDGELAAEFLGAASTTEEFLDRYRPPTSPHTIRWEERFGETRYVPLATEAYEAAVKSAGLDAADVTHLVVTGMHGRAVGRARKALAASGEAQATDDLAGTIGNTGTPHPLLLLADVLDRAAEGETIALVVLADGCDVLLFRATGQGSGSTRTVQDQLAAGRDDLDYLRFLTWRGNLHPEPPRRPAPARASAPASARNADWKFGFVGSRDDATGALHLPPARVSWDGGAVDAMSPAPMADVPARIRTFTVDHLAWSPSPPTIFAVLDFDAPEGGRAGRYACALTDVDPEDVAIGDEVELTFRRLGEADGVVNYFWKARPAARPSTSTQEA